MAESRNLFRLSRFVLLRLPALFKFFAKFRPVKQRLLIIKTDAIGDYILFRNFISILKTSEKYKGYEIDLLANELCKDIALKYDAAFVNRFIFAKPLSLYYKPLQILKLGWQLFCNNYGVVLHPTYTRNFITDGLAALTAAQQIIGFDGDTEGILPKQKLKTDKFYTQRLILPKTYYFEFERTRFFFESVLNSPIALKSIPIPTTNTQKAGIVIFAGAGVVSREWERDKFVELIKLVKQQTSQQIILAGGPNEAKLGEYLEANLQPGDVVSLIGKSTLPQLIDLIAGSALVIANETGAIHIAVATGTKSVCILGGGHFERFAPYPAYFENAPVCVYQKMDCYYCNWHCIYKPAATEVYPCIGKVSVRDVWQAVLPLLPR